MSSSEEEEEEILVHVEFNGMLEKDFLDRSPVLFKMIGVEGKKPVMQIGSQTFAGEYRDVVGTALFFEEDSTPAGGDPVFTKTPEHHLRYVCKTRKSLHMSRVFLKRTNSTEDVNSKCGNRDGSDRDSDVGGNVADDDVQTGSKYLRGNSSDELTMEIEEYPTLVSSKKKRKPKQSELEPIAGPSHAPDVLCEDAMNLDTLMEATTSKSATDKISKLVEEQIKITSDSVKGIVSDSDSISDC